MAVYTTSHPEPWRDHAGTAIGAFVGQRAIHQLLASPQCFLAVGVVTQSALGFRRADWLSEPGHRAAPARGGNHDARIGSRLDVGAVIKKPGEDYRRYKFQLNLDAQDSTLKRLAAQDSHKFYSTADVEIKPDRTEEEEEHAMREFEEELPKNLTE